MNKAEMIRIINADLEHIPKIKNNVSQNLLRYYYNSMRRHNLATTNKSKEDTLKECVEIVKQNDPTFQPLYDRRYFKN